MNDGYVHREVTEAAGTLSRSGGLFETNPFLGRGSSKIGQMQLANPDILRDDLHRIGDFLRCNYEPEDRAPRGRNL
jgi:hypothetical protein